MMFTVEVGEMSKKAGIEALTASEPSWRLLRIRMLLEKSS